jgi:hypothetical protein
MDAILFSAKPKLVNMSDVTEHLRTHERLYFEVRFSVQKEHFAFPLAGFVHVRREAEGTVYADLWRSPLYG